MTQETQSGIQSMRLKAALLSFAVGLLMLVMKVGGYLLTNSAAILSDALESVVHVIATGIALFSVVRVGRPADSKHPYGYGKLEYFSAGAEGALIVIAAIAICREAIGDLISGVTLTSIEIGSVIVGAAGAINLVLGFYLVRVGKRTNSLVLVADGKHVLTDSYTSIGVLVGLILVQITGVVILDPIVAIAVALNIVVTGYKLVRESFRGLMNVTDPETLERTVQAVNAIRTPDMIDMHRLRAWRAGERVFIDFHLTLPYYFSLEQAHGMMHTVEEAITDEFDGHADVLIHMDPCGYHLCVYCRKSDCHVRQHGHELENVFTVESTQKIL